MVEAREVTVDAVEAGRIRVDKGDLRPVHDGQRDLLVGSGDRGAGVAHRRVQLEESVHEVFHLQEKVVLWTKDNGRARRGLSVHLAGGHEGVLEALEAGLAKAGAALDAAAVRRLVGDTHVKRGPHRRVPERAEVLAVHVLPGARLEQAAEGLVVALARRRHRRERRPDVAVRFRQYRTLLRVLLDGDLVGDAVVAGYRLDVALIGVDREGEGLAGRRRPQSAPHAAEQTVPLVAWRAFADRVEERAGPVAGGQGVTDGGLLGAARAVALALRKGVHRRVGRVALRAAALLLGASAAEHVGEQGA
mmetsp:Transcript_50337/g.118459  ORF Transcript_50337/g.118459 Transcript_50337/m.118459 type:complete len:305 (-) Transcript_50337:110-1024(-)